MKVAQTPRGTNRTTQPSTAMRKLMVIRLAGQAYGIPLDVVQEIVPLPLLVQPPGLPPVLAGVFNLAGRSVAVVRLERLFADTDHAPRLYTPLIVLRSVGLPLALMVDEAIGITSVADSDIMPLAENSSFNRCAEGVAMIGDLHVIVVSPDRIMTETEQQRLAGSAALEQARLAVMEGGTS